MKALVTTIAALLLSASIHSADIPRYYPSNCTLQAEYLYWCPCAEGFYVALDRTIVDLKQDETIPFFSGTTDINYKIKSLDFEGKSGIRFTFCFEPPGCHTWGIGVRWLYFNPCASKTVRSEEPTLFPFSTLPMDSAVSNSKFSILDSGLFVFGEALGTRVKGDWRGTLNLVDFPFGSLISYSECICFKPHLDLRIVNWDQHLTIHTSGKIKGFDVITISENDFPNFHSRETFHACFTGVGPRIGGGVEWSTGCGFGLYGDIAFSGLYGKHKSRNAYRAERFDSPFGFGNTTPEGLREKRTQSKSCIRITADIALGFFWEQCVCDESFIQWKLGWEMLYLFNQSITSANTALGVPFFSSLRNNVYDTTTSMPHSDSDVSMQGLTLSGSVNF